MMSRRRSATRGANAVQLWSVWPARSAFRPRGSHPHGGWRTYLQVRAGDRVAVVDSAGVTWFGVAMGGAEPGPLWPSVQVLLAAGMSWYPARDVSLWPTPETLATRAQPTNNDRLRIHRKKLDKDLRFAGRIER